MYGEIIERWQQLCEQAAVEQDPERLIELTTEINRLLLEKKEERLKKMRPATDWWLQDLQPIDLCEIVLP